MTFWHLKKENTLFSSPSQMLEHNKTHQRLNVPPEKGEGMVQKPEREGEKENTFLILMT